MSCMSCTVQDNGLKHEELINSHKQSVCVCYTLPCSIFERMSLASVTLRIDSPWPVQDTAPLKLSAYPPQPYLHETT